MTKRDEQRRIAGRYTKLESKVCLYCGGVAIESDHFIPLKAAEVARNAHPSYKILVPSCSECNHLAGSRLFSSFDEKRQYIQYRLKTKYAKILALPKWTEQEIDALGPAMKDYILSSLEDKARIEDRLNWLGRSRRWAGLRAPESTLASQTKITEKLSPDVDRPSQPPEHTNGESSLAH